LAYYPDGVVDVCIIVVSLFKNPLREKAVELLSDILLQRRRAAIPLAAILGAYHIVTRYLRIPAQAVKTSLVKMLETRSPAFYPHVLLDDVINAIAYAIQYGVESWDGYIIKLAKTIGNGVVYTFDEEFERVRGLKAVNPFPRDLVKRYHEYIRSVLRKSGERLNPKSLEKE